MKRTLTIIIVAFMLVLTLGIISADPSKIYKTDNYHVENSNPIIPGFGVINSIITALSALGVFFVVRRSN